MSFLGSLFGSKPPAQSQISNPIDMTTHAASLASNPTDIDLLIDKVRSITSKLQPGQTLSDADNQELIDIYLKLETYLTTKEPIRSFSKEDLRAKLSPELRKQVAYHEVNSNGEM
ncbi:MAG: hypothetical protein ACQR33_02020 [Candidatus Saccharibacteria bacterium]